jgi:hypothetical protein
VKCFKGILIAAAAAILLFSWIAPGFCGYVITEADGTRSLVSNGKIKSLPGDMDDETVIMDLKKGEMILLSNTEKTATKTTIDEFCAMMEQVGQAMAQAMAQFQEQSGAGGQFPVPGADQKPPEVRVEKTGSGGSIAGYDTQKYTVYADGQLYEELWITTEKKLIDEVGGLDKIARFEQCANQVMAAESSVESDPAYLSVATSGWVLKSVSHEDDVAEALVDVRSIEPKDIPDSEFAIPDDYELVPFEEMFEME